MEKKVLVFVTGGVLAVLSYYYTPMLLYPVFVIAAVVCGAAFAFLRGGYELRRLQTQPKPPVARTFAVLSRLKPYPAPTLKPTLLSANVDSHIQRVLELILKHHVIPTYSVVATDPKSYFNSLTPELWNVLHILLNRVSHVDTVKLVSQDVVEAIRKHFVPFRGFQVNNPLPPGVTVFPDVSQFPYLTSPEKEREFLQKVIDVLLCACLPNEYLKCTPVRVMIREYLLCHIVQPTIDRVCEPDYINKKLLAYLLRKEEGTSVEKKYAHTDYEEFMTYVQKCEDVTELSQIRQSIIMDIMQAKAVQHMKETSSTGLRVATLPVSIPAEKAKMLMERDLSLYINQLNTAKNKCERRIRKLGGENYQQLAHSVEPDRIIQDFPLPIPFDSIMHNDTAFMYFTTYLEHNGYGSLPLFWKEVQNLKETLPHDLPQHLHNLYTKFLCQGASNQIHVYSEIVQGIEKSLSHTDSCLASMRQLQSSVYTELQEQFYVSFLHSQSFKDFMECEAEQESGALFRPKDGSSSLASPSLEESSYQKRLKLLQQKISQKDTAISAMPASAAKRREKLVRDKSVLEEEIKRVEHYIGHTEEWFGTVGQWVVVVNDVDLFDQEGTNEKNPIFILVVHRPESSEVEHLRLNPHDLTQSITGSMRVHTVSEGSSDSDGVITLQDSDDVVVPKNAGWVIPRRLSEFQELHKKVSEFWPDLVFPQIPKKPLLFPRKDEIKSWKKFCQTIESYMNTILKDPKMQESEDVFNFLSPASAEMRQSSTTREDKSAKVRSLPTLPTFFEGKSEESILDHFSALITEVFELQDRSRILRRQLYDLVQLTYGGSIDRELQDFVMWVLSEPMLVYYLETFRESMWPNGEPAQPPPVRSDEQKQKTREEAKQMFVKAVPPNLQTILGHRDCKKGFLKIFAALQDRHANKQLFYSLLELFLFALVPELETVHNEET